MSVRTDPLGACAPGGIGDVVQDEMAALGDQVGRLRPGTRSPDATRFASARVPALCWISTALGSPACAAAASAIVRIRASVSCGVIVTYAYVCELLGRRLVNRQAP